MFNPKTTSNNLRGAAVDLEAQRKFAMQEHAARLATRKKHEFKPSLHVNKNGDLNPKIDYSAHLNSSSISVCVTNANSAETTWALVPSESGSSGASVTFYPEIPFGNSQCATLFNDNNAGYGYVYLKYMLCQPGSDTMYIYPNPSNALCSDYRGAQFDITLVYNGVQMNWINGATYTISGNDLYTYPDAEPAVTIGEVMQYPDGSEPGINISGAEWDIPRLPDENAPAEYIAAGYTMVRFPIKLEPLLYGVDLSDPNFTINWAPGSYGYAVITRLQQWVDEYDINVNVEFHNYMSYAGKTIGPKDAPMTQAQYARAAQQFAQMLHNSIADMNRITLGLMNEPMVQDGTELVFENQQAAKESIYSANQALNLTISGNAYTTAQDFYPADLVNGNAWYGTPNNAAIATNFSSLFDENTRYEAHRYYNEYGTPEEGCSEGCYTKNMDNFYGFAQQYPMINFYIGETGITNSAQCSACLTPQTDLLRQNLTNEISVWAGPDFDATYTLYVADNNVQMQDFNQALSLIAVTQSPTFFPTKKPTGAPTSATPTQSPTELPTHPTFMPTFEPTFMPTNATHSDRHNAGEAFLASPTGISVMAIGGAAFVVLSFLLACYKYKSAEKVLGVSNCFYRKANASQQLGAPLLQSVANNKG